MVPLESYADVPVEQMLYDWKWMSLFFNRVNTAMGKNPLYPFEIPPPVAAKLGFVQKVIRETVTEHPRGGSADVSQGRGFADELFDLTDRVVLVTGGSRGLGREMAFAAAQCGADVVIASRKYDAARPPPRRSPRPRPRRAAVCVHVGRWDELDGLVDAAYERFGKVDVLINNAGMSPLYESLVR